MKAVFVALLFLLLSTSFVVAKEETSFPQCSAPSGEVKVSYLEGIHGIIGSSNIYRGKDVVYNIDQNRVLQCFCPASGEGIQTNWLKVDGATQDQIDSYKNQGWNFVPDGRHWGLDDSIYFAKNSSFSCNDGSGAGGGGSVLGYEATGDSLLLLLLFVSASFSFLFGLKFLKQK